MSTKPRTSVIYRGKYTVFLLYAQELSAPTGDLTARLAMRPLAAGEDAIDQDAEETLHVDGEVFEGDELHGPGWIFPIPKELSIELTSGTRHMLQIDVIDDEDQPRASRFRIVEVREPGNRPEGV